MGTKGAPQTTHSFGYWVRRRRLALDLTQVALARRVGCSPSTIKKIERDERRPSRATAERLAQCLDIGDAEQEVFVATALAERAPHRLALTAKPVGDPPALALLQGRDGSGDRDQIPFVGRSSELRELRRWWAEAPGEVVLVSGEAGVGKSRLVAEFSRDVAGECMLLYGRAVEGSGSSYEPVLGALREFVLIAAESELDALSDTTCAALARLIPEMAERRPASASVAAAWTEIDRSWLLGAVVGAFGVLGRPALLAVEDLQWAETPALLLLERLARGGPHVRVLATCRDPAGAGTGPTDFLAQLRRADVPVRRIELGGLSHDDVVALMQGLGERASSPARHDLSVDLHRRTGGNPFFVRETIRHLAETGELGTPASVQDVIGQRLAALGPVVGEALRAAAVVGEEFDVDVLAFMLQRDDGEVVAALDTAVAAGLVREDSRRVDRYGLVHALVREVLLSGISLSRRSRLEWRAGEAIEALRSADVYEHAAAVARHFAAGVAVGEAAKMVRSALRAGETALRGLAYEEALGHYERGLAALDRSDHPADAERADLLIALGRASTAAGMPNRRWGACLEAAELARRIDDPERLTRAAITLLGPLGPGVVDDGVATLLEEAADALRGTLDAPGRRALLAEALARLSGYLTDERPERAADLRDEALELAREAGDERTLALALMLSTTGFALERDEQQRRLVEAAALAEGVGDTEVVLAAHSRSMAGALTWADRDGYDHHLAEYARVADTTRSPLHMLLSAVDHAGAAAIDGRYEGAVERTRHALRASDSFDDPNLAGNIRLTALPAIRELGRLPAIEARLREGMDTGPHPPLGRAMLAHVLCQCGEFDEARDLLEPTMADPAVRQGGELRRLTLALFAEVAAALEDARAAEQLIAWLEQERGDCVIAGPNAFFGALRRYLGLLAFVLGRADEAVTHHKAALAVHERMRAPGWAARSRYDLARVLIACGDEADRVRAAGLMEETFGAAQRLGMAALLEEALLI